MAAILNDSLTLQQFNSTFTYNGRRPADFFRGAVCSCPRGAFSGNARIMDW